MNNGPIKVGIMEYEDELWLPSKFDNNDAPYESKTEECDDINVEGDHREEEDSKANSSDDEGISDTRMDEAEDGEILDDATTTKAVTKVDTTTPDYGNQFPAPTPTPVACWLSNRAGIRYFG